MEFWTSIVLFLTVVIGISWIFREIQAIHYTHLCSLKGPEGLPIFGSIFPLIRHWKYPMKQYSKWGKQFGGIYKVKIGSQLAVIVSEAKIFARVFGKTGSKLNYRVRGNVLSWAMGNKGLATSDGDIWLEHRKFSTKAFRELNIGRTDTDDLIYSEISKLVEHIESNLKVLEFYEHAENDLSINVFNVLWYFVSGTESIPLKSEKYCEILKMMKGTRMQMKAAEQSGGYNFYFILQILWIIAANPLRLLQSFIHRVLFVKKELQRNKENPHSKSLVQLYLKEIGTNPRKELNENQLETFMSDFIVAGVESLTSSIRWTLLYLAVNPEILESLRTELDEKLKFSSIAEVACYRMRHELPYLEAVIAESLRIRPPIHTIVHVNKEDMILEDNFIPKSTWIVGNIWGIHHNNNTWENHKPFQPQRFLNANSQLRRDRFENCASFSTGPRRCLGEQLSRMELHAFVCILVTKFDISLNPTKLDYFSLEPDVGLSILPKDNFLIFKNRAK